MPRTESAPCPTTELILPFVACNVYLPILACTACAYDRAGGIWMDRLGFPASCLLNHTRATAVGNFGPSVVKVTTGQRLDIRFQVLPLSFPVTIIAPIATSPTWSVSSSKCTPSCAFENGGRPGDLEAGRPPKVRFCRLWLQAVAFTSRPNVWSRMLPSRQPHPPPNLDLNRACASFTDQPVIPRQVRISCRFLRSIPGPTSGEQEATIEGIL